MERSAPKKGDTKRCLPLLCLQGGFTAARTENTELVNGQVSSICQGIVNCHSGKNSFHCEDRWVWEQVAQKGRRVSVLSYIKLAWISLWANCCRWPCSEQGAWDGAGSRSVALWFCESVSSSAHSIFINWPHLCWLLYWKYVQWQEKVLFSIFPVCHCYLLSCNDLLAIF